VVAAGNLLRMKKHKSYDRETAYQALLIWRCRKSAMKNRMVGAMVALNPGLNSAS
jgi:hypothetical protein